MNMPSIKTLMERLALSKEQASELRRAMERGRGLAVANRLLNGEGIITIDLPDTDNPKCHIQYVNMGDTYHATLLKVDGRYVVSDFGYFAEKYS